MVKWWGTVLDLGTRWHMVRHDSWCQSLQSLHKHLYTPLGTYCFPNFLCSSPQLLLPCYNHSDLHKTPREGYTLLYRVAVIHILSLLQNFTKFFQLPKNQTVSSTELQQIAFLTLLVCPSCLSPSHTDHIPDSPHHNALWSLLRWQLS